MARSLALRAGRALADEGAAVTGAAGNAARRRVAHRVDGPVHGIGMTAAAFQHCGGNVRRRGQARGRGAVVATGAAGGDSRVGEDRPGIADRVLVARLARCVGGEMVGGLADRDRAVVARGAAAHDPRVIDADLAKVVGDVTLLAEIAGFRMLVDFPLGDRAVVTGHALLRRAPEAAVDVARGAVELSVRPGEGKAGGKMIERRGRLSKSGRNGKREHETCRDRRPYRCSHACHEIRHPNVTNSTRGSVPSTATFDAASAALTAPPVGAPDVERIDDASEHRALHERAAAATPSITLKSDGSFAPRLTHLVRDRAPPCESRAATPLDC